MRSGRNQDMCHMECSHLSPSICSASISGQMLLPALNKEIQCLVLPTHVSSSAIEAGHCGGPREKWNRATCWLTVAWLFLDCSFCWSTVSLSKQLSGKILYSAQQHKWQAHHYTVEGILNEAWGLPLSFRVSEFWVQIKCSNVSFN